MKLVERIENDVLERTKLMENEKADNLLNKHLNNENIFRAQRYFRDKFMPVNHELMPVYDEIMRHLLEKIVVKENNLVPIKIIEPGEKESKLVALYRSVNEVDKSLTDYKKRAEKKEKDEKNIEEKIRAAEKGL